MNFSQIKINLFQIAEKLFGKTYIEKLYSGRCASVFRESGVIFIHIPKAGGTSVAKAVLGKRAGHDYASKVKQIMGDKEYGELFSFSVVRNPYDRIVSAYHYAVQGGGSEGGLRKRSVYKSTLFESFSSFVKNWLIFQDPQKIEIIFRPQHLFICDQNDTVLVNWIGKMESVGEIEDKLTSVLKRSIKIGKRNKSRRKDYKDYYNSELEEIVFNFYKKDFLLFGYERGIHFNSITDD